MKMVMRKLAFRGRNAIDRENSFFMDSIFLSKYLSADHWKCSDKWNPLQITRYNAQHVNISIPDFVTFWVPNYWSQNQFISLNYLSFFMQEIGGKKSLFEKIIDFSTYINCWFKWLLHKASFLWAYS